MHPRVLVGESGTAARLQKHPNEAATATQGNAAEHFRQHDGDDGEVREQPGTAGGRADRPVAGGEEEDGSAAAGNAPAARRRAAEARQQGGSRELRHGDDLLLRHRRLHADERGIDAASSRRLPERPLHMLRLHHRQL